MAATITELWRYPIKSMRGEQLDATVAGERGLAGDRAWVIVDTETGKIASAKRPKLWLEMLQCTASYVEEPQADASPPAVRITRADGREVTSDDPDRDNLLSEIIGRPVTLTHVKPEGATYELRELDANGLTASEPEAITESPVGMFAPPGTFFDTSPLHVLSTATVEHFESQHPDGDWDIRRFRPNVVVDLAPQEGGVLAEAGWIGHSLHLGASAQAAVLAQMP